MMTNLFVSVNRNEPAGSAVEFGICNTLLVPHHKRNVCTQRCIKHRDRQCDDPAKPKRGCDDSANCSGKVDGYASHKWNGRYFCGRCFTILSKIKEREACLMFELDSEPSSSETVLDVDDRIAQIDDAVDRLASIFRREYNPAAGDDTPWPHVDALYDYMSEQLCDMPFTHAIPEPLADGELQAVELAELVASVILGIYNPETGVRLHPMEDEGPVDYASRRCGNMWKNASKIENSLRLAKMQAW